MQPRSPIHLRLSPAALAKVDELAEQEERTRSEMLRILLKLGVETYEKRRTK